MYLKASERNQSLEERVGWDNSTRTWGVEPEDRHVIGLLGERAFAIYADLEIETELWGWSDGALILRSQLMMVSGQSTLKPVGKSRRSYR
jgi:hypothetical protein